MFAAGKLCGSYKGGHTRTPVIRLSVAVSNTRESFGENPIFTGSPAACAAEAPCSRTRTWPRSVSTT